MTTPLIINHPLRVQIGCETSGEVRRAFLDRDHDAWSCDVPDVLNDGWDLLVVMHPAMQQRPALAPPPPPGRTKTKMWSELNDGAALFSACWNAPVTRVAVENPVMHRHAKERITNFKPAAQTVQPWWFGEEAFKGTGLYLRGLPPLTA